MKVKILKFCAKKKFSMYMLLLNVRSLMSQKKFFFRLLCLYEVNIEVCDFERKMGWTSTEYSLFDKKTFFFWVLLVKNNSNFFWKKTKSETFFQHNFSTSESLFFSPFVVQDKLRRYLWLSSKVRHKMTLCSYKTG